MRQPLAFRFISVGALIFGLVGSTYAHYPPQQQGSAENSNAEFISGGIGLDQSTYFKQQEGHWPFKMSMAGKGGEYLSDVQVKIVNARGKEVLNTVSEGPFLFARIPAGIYTVSAWYQGVKQVRRVAVGAQAGKVAPAGITHFSWTDRSRQ